MSYQHVNLLISTRVEFGLENKGLANAEDTRDHAIRLIQRITVLGPRIVSTAHHGTRQNRPRADHRQSSEQPTNSLDNPVPG